MRIRNIGTSYCVRDDSGEPFINSIVVAPVLDYVYFHWHWQSKRLMLCYCDRKSCKPDLTIVIMSFA